MSEMVERVAQALYAQGAANSNYPNHYRWETADEAERDRGKDMARAAIDAVAACIEDRWGELHPGAVAMRAALKGDGQVVPR